MADRAKHQDPVRFARDCAGDVVCDLSFRGARIDSRDAGHGNEQEQAALTLGANGWQTFWRVTLPSVKWGLLYGIILCNAGRWANSAPSRLFRAHHRFDGHHAIAGGETVSGVRRDRRICGGEFAGYAGLADPRFQDLPRMAATARVPTSPTRREILRRRPHEHRTQKISKHFGGVAAVNDVSFSVEDGELMALLGPSGGGKTTVLRMIAGLEVPSSGDIYVRGQRVNDVSVQQRNIGFVFQNYALFKNMTVFKNVAFGLKIKKWKRRDIRDRVDELLSLFGLEDLGRVIPISSPAASASAWRSPVHWLPNRACCCSTNLWRRGCQDPPGTPRMAGHAASRAECHHHLRHARPGGGHGGFEPDRDFLAGQSRTNRHAPTGLRGARQRVCCPVHRRDQRARTGGQPGCRAPERAGVSAHGVPRGAAPADRVSGPMRCRFRTT
jgi:hypothetical protein